MAAGLGAATGADRRRRGRNRCRFSRRLGLQRDQPGIRAFLAILKPLQANAILLDLAGHALDLRFERINA
jgi:hypothetical protein